ncbi:MAG TPA: translation initiation factor 2 [Rugosimonospora sp.]|nr:translation initiation factor 2 [Rugosimonospora sp.]
MSADDQWRRPVEYGPRSQDGPVPPPGSGAESPRYYGPPPTSAPPADWRPPTVYEPAPPRELPAQDVPAIEAGEQRARTFTLGVGMVAGTVVLIVLFVLCGRALL